MGKRTRSDRASRASAKRARTSASAPSTDEEGKIRPSKPNGAGADKEVPALAVKTEPSQVVVPASASSASGADQPLPSSESTNGHQDNSPLLNEASQTPTSVLSSTSSDAGTDLSDSASKGKGKAKAPACEKATEGSAKREKKRFQWPPPQYDPYATVDKHWEGAPILGVDIGVDHDNSWKALRKKIMEREKEHRVRVSRILRDVRHVSRTEESTCPLESFVEGFAG